MQNCVQELVIVIVYTLGISLLLVQVQRLLSRAFLVAEVVTHRQFSSFGNALKLL